MSAKIFRKISLFLSFLFFVYALILVLEYSLKKKSVSIFVEDLILEESPSSHRHLGSVHKTYYLKTDEGIFSVNESYFRSFQIGDSLKLRKTLFLNLNFDLSDYEGNKQSIYGSVFNYFPLFPVLLIICFLAQLTKREEVFYYILRPLSLFIAALIVFMSIWVNI